MEAMYLYIIKMIVVSAVFYSYYHFVLRDRNFHNYNRFYLITTMLLSLILPLIRLSIFAAEESVAPLYFPADLISEVVVLNTPSAFIWGWKEVLTAVYLLVLGTLTVLFLLSLIRLARIRHRGSKTVFKEFVLIETPSKGTPFSFFRNIFWHPDADTESAEGRKMMQHEMVHVRQMHSLDKLVINLVQILFWFNPVFWLVKRELSIIHEFLADRETFAGHEAHQFSLMTLHSAFPGYSWPANNRFFHSPMRRRLLMILKNNKMKVNYFSRVMALPIAAVLLIFFSQRVAANQNHTAGAGDAVLLMQAADTIPPATSPAERPVISSKDSSRTVIFHGSKPADAVYFVDGVRVDVKEVDSKVKAEDIIRVNVFKGARAQAMTGDSNARPVIEIVTNKDADTIHTNKLILIPGKGTKGGSAIYRVDGKPATIAEVEGLDPKNIAFVRVTKGSEAVRLHGTVAKDGIVEIETADNSRVRVISPSSQTTDIRGDSIRVKGYRLVNRGSGSGRLTEAGSTDTPRIIVNLNRERDVMERERQVMEKERAEMERQRAAMEKERVNMEKERIKLEQDRKAMEEVRKELENRRRKTKTPARG